MTNLEAILEELESAKRKLPWWPTDPVHAAAIVAEEAGELVKASLEFTYERGGRGDLYIEAKQTAAMALRFMEHLLAYEPEDLNQMRDDHKTRCEKDAHQAD